MHDPSHVAFSIRRPWPSKWAHPFGGRKWYWPDMATAWHTNPRGHDSGSQGGCCPHRPKLTAKQEAIVKSIASWEHAHPFLISRRNVGPGDAAALSVAIFQKIHWELHRNHNLPNYLWKAAFEFGLSEVDGCRTALSQPPPPQNLTGNDLGSYLDEVTWALFRSNGHSFSTEAERRYGKKGEKNPVPLEEVEDVVRMFLHYYLRRRQPWWKKVCWVPWHYRLQVHALQHLRRWLFMRCAKCGKRFKWGESPCTPCWDNSHVPFWKFWHFPKEYYHSDCSGRAVSACATGSVDSEGKVSDYNLVQVSLVQKPVDPLAGTPVTGPPISGDCPGVKP